MKFLIFVGNPRTGHSLIGAMIDAHKDAVVSHELHALEVYQAAGKDEMVRRIKANSVQHARDGKKGQKVSKDGRPVLGYDYKIEGLHQGIVPSNPLLIGDKRGFSSTEMLSKHPGFLDRFAKETGFDVKLVHVIRNPYDTIATWSRLVGDGALGLFALGSRTVKEIKSRHNVLDVYLEDVIDDPKKEIRRVLGHLGLDEYDDYVGKCTSVVFPKTSHSRDDKKWIPSTLVAVDRYVSQFKWLERYRGTRPEASP